MDPGNPGRMLLADASDAVVAERLRALGTEFGLTVDPPDPTGAAPAVAVINLDRPGAVQLVGDWRARWPDALLAGYLGVPDQGTWVAAQRAGCDVVANRGAVIARLRTLLADTAGRQRRFPLLDAADAAGRLGLIARFAQTPVGPIALYRAAGRLCAIRDRCPHAGGVLSEGELDGSVATCPAHGSQFDVLTGARVRGPADVDVDAYRVVEDAGQISLVVPG